MLNLKDISKVFLLKSKALTISCISSILIAVVLIISMLNLTMNAEASYGSKLRATYGNIDAIASYQTFSGIPETIIEQIEASEGIKEISAGYFDADFMIEENSVYLVGSDNSNMMKSRYHYKNDLLKGEVAVNSVLADCLHCKVDDTIKISGYDFRVKEIMEEVSGSAVNYTMAILNQVGLAQVLGKTPESNFMLIDVKDNYEMDFAVKNIRSIDGLLHLNIVEADELYKTSIEAFSIFIKALEVCVILVTGLFVASTMKRFIYKYNHDMAIIRAIGGNKKQIKVIFRHIINIINMLGCAGGFLISILLNKIILGLINKKLQLVEGDIRFFFFRSLIVVFFIFAFLTFILQVSIQKSFKVLPLEALMENELNQIGKRKKRLKNYVFYRFSRLFGKDTFIMIKTMFTRFKENFLITGTIIIIVVISFIGGSLSSIIQKNNNEYLKREYLTDIIVTSSTPMLYKDIIEYYEQLQSTEGIYASLTLSPGVDASFQNKPLRFKMADFNSMQKQGILKNKIAGSNPIILSDEIAEKFKVSVSDEINVTTPPEYILDSKGLVAGTLKNQSEVRMQVTEVLPKNILQYNDAFIDIHCIDFVLENDVLDRIYINGDSDIAEQILSQIKNRYTGIKWSNLEEVKKAADKALNERFVMFEVVVCILIIIAGLGWVNAIRHTILSRNDEYKVLRIHGMTIARLRKMLMKHILLYLLIGIVLGIGFGIAVLMLLTYLEGGTSLIIVNYPALALITAFLIMLTLMLIPDVLKVSKAEVIMND
jgi:putative ABC transport system permease protein